jgi:hypothetical protein
MRLVAVAVAIALIAASGGLGYFIGATSQGGAKTYSHTTIVVSTYPLQILTANWTNPYTSQSGWCGELSLHSFNASTGVIHMGPPYAMCDVTVGPGEAGTMELRVQNSGNNATIVFEDQSVYPVYYLNSQGCGPPQPVIALCSIGGHTTALFTMYFESYPGNYKPMNVTLNVVVAVLAPS